MKPVVWVDQEFVQNARNISESHLSQKYFNVVKIPKFSLDIKNNI